MIPDRAHNNYPTVRAARGEVVDKVVGWVASQPVGKEFGYPEMAAELDVNPASAENVLRRMSEHENPAVTPGYRRGRWRITGESASPIVTRRLAAVPARPAVPAASALSVGDVLEVFMHAKDGSPVLRDERGMGWKAVPL